MRMAASATGTFALRLLKETSHLSSARSGYNGPKTKLVPDAELDGHTHLPKGVSSRLHFSRAEG